MSPLAWMTDPNLCGQTFGGPTWEAGRALVAAIFGEPMTPTMLEIYRECTQRTMAPIRAFARAMVAAGRGAGKTLLAVFVGVFIAASRNWREMLGPGELATVAIICPDRRQARVAIRYARGLLRLSPMLANLIESETADSITLTTGAVIEIHTASFKSTRGYSFAAVILDECSFLPTDEAGANPDVELVRAVAPGLARVPSSLLLAISSPYAKRGVLWDAFQRHHGVDDAPVLTWRAPTRRMNPTIGEATVAEALADDEAAARSEWLAEFRADLESYATSEAVRAVCIEDRIALPPLPNHAHACFVDSAAGGPCAYTAAIYHVTRENKVVIDRLIVLDPPLNTSHGATRHVAGVCKEYGVSVIYGDAFAGDWCSAEFAKHGLSYMRSPLVKTDLFLEALPVILSGACELPDPAASAEGRRLFRELVGLQRRVGKSRSGREEIIKPRGQGDDAANAVCGALALARRFNPNRQRIARAIYG